MRVEEALDVIDLWVTGKLPPNDDRLEIAMQVYDGLVERIEAQAILLAKKQLKRETCLH